MPNTEWFLIFPFTKVSGDLGPEGRRDLIVANGELDSLVARMRATLAASNRDDHRLNESSLPIAAELLLGKSAGEIRQPTYLQWMPTLVAAAGGVDFLAAGLVGLGLGVSGKTFLPRLNQRALLSGAAAIGLVTGGFLIDTGGAVSPFAQCDPNYSGCVPVAGDVDCADLDQAVQVTGRDIYQLDRDSDGIACETLDPAE
jgi:hypothetical protein